MSADTLRRAAQRLRERATEAAWGYSGRWTCEPGSTVHMDSTGDFTIRPAGDGTRTVWLLRGVARFGVGEWVETVDPTVGILLAAWLDAVADHAESNALVITGWVEANALAEAVLREGSER